MFVNYAFQIGDSIDRNKSCLKCPEKKSQIRREELIQLISSDVSEEIDDTYELRILNNYIDSFELSNENIIYFEDYGITNSIFIIIKLIDNEDKVISENEEVKCVESSIIKLNDNLLKTTVNVYEYHDNVSAIFTQSSNNLNHYSINLFFLYFNSLTFDEESNQSLNYLVDFEPEIIKFSNFFQNLNKKIKVSFEIANQSNFSQILKQKPNIIFISCIGIFKLIDNKPEFSICLEDDYGNLSVISLECFKILTNNNNVNLIIVSTNYSKSVQEFFVQAGFPNIICVYSKFHTLDKAGMNFLKSFFKYILDGNSLSDSYEFSKKIITNKEKNYREYIPCCCHHEYVRPNNKQCNLMKKIIEYDKYYFCSLHNVNEKGFNKKNSCTCNLKEFKHSLEEKFMMKFRENIILVNNVEDGKPEIFTTKLFEKFKLGLNLKNNIFLGRNERILEICNMLLSNPNKRIYNLIGERGLGKKTLVKLVAKFFSLRSKFKNIVYVESNIFYTSLFIKSCFENQLNLCLDGEEELFQKISDVNLIIIIVVNNLNKNDIIDKFIDDFYKKTKSPILLLVSNEPFKSNQFTSEIIQLENLHENDSKRLFSVIINNSSNPKNFHDLLDKMDYTIIKNPGYLRILGTLPLDKNMKNSMLNYSRFVLEEKIFGKYLNDTDYLKLLYLILLCPNGVIVENIQKILYKDFHDKIKELLNKHHIIKKKINMTLNQKIISLLDYSENTLNFIDNYTPEIIKHKLICQMFSFYRTYFRNITILKKHEINVENEFTNKNYGLWFSLKVVTEKIKNEVPRSPYQIPRVNKVTLNEKTKNLSRKSHSSLGRISNISAIHKGLIGNYKESYVGISNDHVSVNESPNENVQEHTYSTPTRIHKYNSYSSIQSDSFYKIENRYPVDEHPQTRFCEKEFYFHIHNLGRIIDPDFIKENFDQENFEEIKDDFEDLSITVPVLLDYFKEYEESVNLIMKFIFICMCEEYDLILCRGRLILFFVQNFKIFNKFKFKFALKCEDESQYFNKEGNTHIVTNINNQEEISLFIESLLDNIFKNEFKKFYEGQAEVILLKTIKFLEENESDDKKIQKILCDLKECYEKYETCEDLIGKAKVGYFLASIYILQSNFNESILEKLNNSKILLHNEKLYVLSLNCLCRIIEWFLGIDNLVQARVFLLESKEYLKKYIDVSTQRRIYQKINIKINHLEIKIHEKLRRINEHIIYFMKGHQLMKKHNDKVIAVEPVVQYVSNFKAKILENFQEIEKKVIMNFDILNEDNLEEVFKSGCRILHISNEVYDNSDSLYVEDKLGMTVEINSSKLVSLLAKYGPLLDLIILAFPQSMTLGEFLIRNGIPNVICFHFKKEFLKLNTDYPIFSVSNIFLKFTKKLLKNLIKKEKTLKESFHKAKKKFNESIKNVTDKFVNFNIKIDLLKFASTELLSRTIDQDKPMIFNEGKLKDISKLRTLNKLNINKRQFHFVGRKRELLECLESIKNNKDVILYGKPGVGKTCFVKELGYYLNMRNYFITGIYYFDLAEFITMQDFLKVNPYLNKLEEQLGNVKLKTINNSILIIFDNCDKIMNNDRICFVNFISRYNKMTEKGVYFIITCNYIGKQSKKYNIIKLKKLNLKESVMLFLLNINRIVTRGEISNKKTLEEDNIIELLYKNKNIKHCIGFPKEIKKLAELTNRKRLKEITFNEFSNKPAKHLMKNSLKLSLTMNKKKTTIIKNSNTILSDSLKKSRVSDKKYSDKNFFNFEKNYLNKSLRISKGDKSNSPFKLNNRLSRMLDNRESESPFAKGTNEEEEEESDFSPEEFEDQCDIISNENCKGSSIGSSYFNKDFNESSQEYDDKFIFQEENRFMKGLRLRKSKE
jgi:hypothetical protein